MITTTEIAGRDRKELAKKYDKLIRKCKVLEKGAITKNTTGYRQTIVCEINHK